MATPRDTPREIYRGSYSAEDPTRSSSVGGVVKVSTGRLSFNPMHRSSKCTSHFLLFLHQCPPHRTRTYPRFRLSGIDCSPSQQMSSALSACAPALTAATKRATIWKSHTRTCISCDRVCVPLYVKHQLLLIRVSYLILSWLL
jgi:hypothetical protein